MAQQNLLEHLAWLNDKHQPMLELVERLCNLNSGTLNLSGLDRVCKELCEAYAVLGGEMKVESVPPMTSVNDQGQTVPQPLGQAIFITKYATRRPRVLLCIHMDTVYDVDHPFQKCRFLDANRLNGPGVVDAKGGLVVMLFALQTLERSPLAGKIGWQVIINPDEELGSPGSGEMLHAAAMDADWGLLFEPSLPDGTMVSWRKGSGNFSFVVKGRAAHAGRDFHAGRNAVVAMSRLMTQIAGFNTDPDVTYNVGRVSGGGALNIVPDLAVGRVNVRVRNVEQQTLVESELQRLVAEACEQDGIDVQMQGGFTSPPKTIDAGTERLQRIIEQCGDQLGINVKWQGTGGASDGNKFAAAGLANIDTLGPSGGDIHSNREYLIVESLVPRAKLASLLLLNLAAGVGSIEK
jgi:glutamate carboxypeptidase